MKRRGAKLLILTFAISIVQVGTSIAQSASASNSNSSSTTPPIFAFFKIYHNSSPNKYYTGAIRLDPVPLERQYTAGSPMPFSVYCNEHRIFLTVKGYEFSSYEEFPFGKRTEFKYVLRIFLDDPLHHLSGTLEIIANPYQPPEAKIIMTNLTSITASVFSHYLQPLAANLRSAFSSATPAPAPGIRAASVSYGRFLPPTSEQPSYLPVKQQPLDLRELRRRNPGLLNAIEAKVPVVYERYRKALADLGKQLLVQLPEKAIGFSVYPTHDGPVAVEFFVMGRARPNLVMVPPLVSEKVTSALGPTTFIFDTKTPFSCSGLLASW